MTLGLDDASFCAIFASQLDSFLDGFADGSVYAHSMEYNIVAL
jgi:hypothetical protein